MEQYSKGGEPVDEKELIKKSKDGNIESFEKLIEAHQLKVYNISLKMLKNEQDAFDASQDALLKAFKYIGKFKEEASFSTWLYRITVNVCLDMLKKRKDSYNTLSLEQQISLKDNEVQVQFEDKKQNVLNDVLKSEQKKALYEAIDKLSAEHKKMIVLRDIEGFSYEEIAKITNKNLGTVKSKINRARASLKEILIKNKELFLSVLVLYMIT